MSDPFVFETDDGREFTFNTEDELLSFAVDYTLGNLVTEGLGNIVDVDGTPGFKVSEKGFQYLRDKSENTDPINQH